MRVAFAIVLIAAAAAGFAAGPAGCSEPTGPRTVGSEHLTVKIPAIKEAARSGDMTAAPQLVADLDSDDAAVRLYAFQALRELAGGQTCGYVYYADAEQRRPAVAKWRQWLQQQGAATRPARER